MADAALTGSTAASASGDEGATATLTNATFTDANPGDHTADFTATINWGDGRRRRLGTAVPVTAPALGSYTVAGSHIYAEEGTYTHHRDGQDDVDDGGKQHQITGTATWPTRRLTGRPRPARAATEGATATLTDATFTDANPGDHRPTSRRRSTGATAPAPTTRARCSYSASTGIYTVAGSHTYAEEGTYTLTITVKTTSTTAAQQHHDHRHGHGGRRGPDRQRARRARRHRGRVGVADQRHLHRRQPGRPPADFTATINWGDGTAPTTRARCSYSGSTRNYTVAGSHTYAEEGTYTHHHDGQRRRRRGGTSSTTITGTATVADAALTGERGERERQPRARRRR